MDDDKRPVGRPKKEINQKDFEKLCRLFCTKQDIADWFDCSLDTIENWCDSTYSDNFSAIYKRLSVEGRSSLRRKQYEIAMAGNPTLLIWLGKQHLDQVDKKEVTGADGSAIQIVIESDERDL